MSRTLSVLPASQVNIRALTPCWQEPGWSPPSASEIYLVMQQAGLLTTKQVAEYLCCEPRSVTRWLNPKQNTRIGYADWCLLCDAAGIHRFWLFPKTNLTTDAELPKEILHIMRMSRFFGDCSALDVATVMYSCRALNLEGSRENDGSPRFIVDVERLDLKYILGTSHFKRVIEYCQTTYPTGWMSGLSTRLKNILLGNGLFIRHSLQQAYKVKEPDYWRNLHGMGEQTYDELIQFIRSLDFNDAGP